MLQRLQIKGLAIIDELEIEFVDGFNVITGETGAGKSILIKALSLLFGDKSSVDIIRHGCSEAEVTGVFNMAGQHPVTELLNSIGIDYGDDDDDLLIIRRRIQAKGRNQIWINGTLVTRTIVRQVTGLLMDVFGQHASYGLLNPIHHVKCLDVFLSKPEVKVRYQESYNKAQKTLKRLEDLVSEYRQRAGEHDYLTYRYNELSEFAPSTDEYEKLLKLCQSSEKAFERKQELTKVLEMLEQSHNHQPLSKFVWEATKKLGDQGTEFKSSTESLTTAAKLIDDVSYELRRYYDSIDVSEHELQDAQERLKQYQSLFRRFSIHGATELVAKMESMAQDLDFVESARHDIQSLIKELTKDVESLSACAKKLTKARKLAFKSIKGHIEKELHLLAMPGACFDVEWAEVQNTLSAIELADVLPEQQEALADIFEPLSTLNSEGAERIHFLLKSNPGEASRPLHKVASGGEMSRIMLALKKVLSLGAETCVLVFDEIDAGISGEVADIVGQKLSELSKHFQIICISHLPQVSAYADTHFLVSKSRGQRTESRIERLSDKQSIEELARLLSGDKVTSFSLQNAKSLKKNAKNFIAK